MEFAVRSSDLLREIGLVQGVVERRTTIPILSNVRVEARGGKKGGEIEIVATDLDVGVRTVCDAVVVKPGSVTLPARRLHDLVRLLPDSEVQFQVKDGTWASIVCERTRYRLAGAGVEDFPNLPEHDFAGALSLPLDPLKRMIERVIFAISNEDPRFAIKGALLLIEGGVVTLVATDGHRLAMISQKGVDTGGASHRVLLPRKTLGELLKFEPGPEGEVKFGVDGNHLFFKMGRRLLQSNTLEGDFPKYEKVIPDKNDRIVTVAAGALKVALERVSLLSQERSKLVRLTIDTGKLILSTQNPETGEAEETIAAECSGPLFHVGFNSRYLMDYLGASTEERVRLELKDEATQGLLRPEHNDEFDYRYVVMPMRLN
jgi:DNA polymerase-3 subunit beta